jgi:hypothetical protein
VTMLALVVAAVVLAGLVAVGVLVELVIEGD